MKQEFRKNVVLDLEDKIKLQKIVGDLTKFLETCKAGSEEYCNLSEAICYLRKIEINID